MIKDNSMFEALIPRFPDYELIDSGDFEKLERFGRYVVRRPEPQAIWRRSLTEQEWRRLADASFLRDGRSEERGEWRLRSGMPSRWTVDYAYEGMRLRMRLGLTSFKHVGLFPEQAANWDFAMEQIRRAGRPIRVLNLFAYTGGATLAAAAAGASVTHVDASKGMVNWAKENAAVSGLSDKPIRWLVDDCTKFVEREIRRGNHYDAIIMDPPSYGRGPKGEIWKIEESIHPFIKLCTQLLSDDPLFFLVNSYTTGLAPAVLTYMIFLELKQYKGHVEAQEIGLPVKSTGLVLPCGASGRWQSDNV